ncbi:MAG: DUF3524 domain-containing protein [Candidatus Eisenbacteria bacterium]|nr:DUF3524 domain-containing protein [Candidatus Eisenbacteria bacterium]
MPHDMVDLLLIEPYFGGSHRQFAEGIRRHSRHHVRLATLPGRYWRWRMRGSAPLFEERLRKSPAPGVILASSMFPLAEFLGLAPPRFREAKTILYFHENQLTYPLPEGERRDLHAVMTQINGALAADRILFNSRHHRREMLGALPGFLRALPDHKPPGVAGRFRRSRVLPLGVDFESLGPPPRRRERKGEPILLWNHRWEHDKGREEFALLIRRLRRRKVPFGLVVTGASPGTRSDLFEELPRIAGDRLRHVGFAPSRRDYARLLAGADLAVSTARHEFFGVSVLEAIHMGAFPLLPERLAYPEILDPGRHPECYYRSREELFDRAEELLTGPRPPVERYRRAAARFAWPHRIGAFDRLFEEILGS